MDNTQAELKDAILEIADSFKIKNSYIALIGSSLDLPKIIRMIVYDMFLYDFNIQTCTDKQWKACYIIKEYANELQINGAVNFK